MDEEGLEEWDAEFLDQVIQVQERVISDSQKPLNHQQQREPPSSHANPITYSPPRHLSQRSNAVSSSSALPPRVWSSQLEIGRLKMTASSSSAAFPPCVLASECDKEHEIGRLKTELGKVLKQLSHYEQECSELKKERDKKDEQLKFVLLRNEKKDVTARNSESANLESGDTVLANHESSRQFQTARSSSHHPSSRVDIGVPTSKATGVQTDETSSSAEAIPNDDLHISNNLSKKLLAIWGSPNEQELGRNVISNLLMACQTDFHSLSGCIGMNISSKLRMNTPGGESSCIAASQNIHLSHTPEAAKVSHLYSVLTKVNNGMIKLDALFEPLVDLCSLKNVVIVQASLHILHLFLKHLLSLERQVEGRVNVMVEGLVRGNQTSYADSPPLGMEFAYTETESKNGDWNNVVATLVSHIDWVSLFEVIIQTAMRNAEQCIRLQAVCIMNVILMRTNAFMEREKFGRTLVFEMISELLAKEAGFEVRNQAVQLLYMLLNCPKILVKFCSGYKEEKGAGATDEIAGDALTFQKGCVILQGLADCLACCGHSLEELKLCQNAVLLLAFLASSGKFGFEILVNHKLLQDANFLMLILQVLAAVDAETTVNPKQPQLYKERTLLIREALILLNRLASNPAYSATVLRLLTHSRDMASLAIDVASRLSRKDRIREKFDSMRESDIGDLARVFKKRVFTYLGDNIS
ncbi:hypothetical protein M0R45_025276 [Rubus argutus]|uniref:Uncharacterized protein n=1 Tax=Rubus argutus TaxID=59490 RepID=A0AAW1WWG4_RUBAR